MKIFFYISVFMSFALLCVVYSFCGGLARRKPIIFFLLGIGVAASGVLIWFGIESIAKTFSMACTQKLSTDCAWQESAEIAKKLIELGFAAVGAGLISLSMDLRSQHSNTEDVRALETQENDLNEGWKQWSIEHDKLGEDLGLISAADAVKKFKWLKNQKLNLLLRGNEIRDLRRALFGLNVWEDMKREKGASDKKV